jgi:hypothetical protein
MQRIVETNQFPSPDLENRAWIMGIRCGKSKAPFGSDAARGLSPHTFDADTKHMNNSL